MEFIYILCLLFLNFIILKQFKVSGTFFHLTIAFLPFILSLPVGRGVHNLLFLLVGIFYLIIKMANIRLFQRHEWLSTSVMGILIFFAMYTLLGHSNNMFNLFLVIELIFLLGLMLVVGNKSSDRHMEYYFIPNLITGIIAGACVLFFIFATQKINYDLMFDISDAVEAHLVDHLYLHFIILVFVFCLCYKLYMWPGNFLVPNFYSILTTSQTVIFSTIFVLPYIHIITVCLTPLPFGYRIILFILATLTIIWCVVYLGRETRLKALIGVLTVFTQNVLVFILISGPSHFTHYHIYLCLIFLFFYFLSIMPFLYLISRSDSETVLDVRLEVFLMNTFKSYIFYLSWLALAGIPLTFLYVTKIATLTHLLGHVSAGFALWIYLIMSFYIYVVLFIFLILSKEIYILHKKDLNNISANKEQPWVRRVVGILPWVLLIVLYLLFFFVALSFF